MWIIVEAYDGLFLRLYLYIMLCEISVLEFAYPCLLGIACTYVGFLDFCLFPD